MATVAEPADATADRPATAYAWYVLFVLILAYTVAYIDRTILTLMVDPIKRSLHLSDVELSLLHGLAFAVFYTVLGIPIARLADRHKRTTIISTGIFIWSLMTALCGFTRTFGQLFAARVGVGVGEAALSPAAYSILADSFPPSRLARALSIYTGAIYLGSGVALIAGGAVIGLVPPMVWPVIGPMAPWQTIFIIVGAPGILVAAWIATLREPKRRGLAMAADAFPSVGEVGRYVVGRRGTYGLMILGTSIASLMWNGVTGWIPTFFIRDFGWSAGEVGLWFGLAMLTCGSAGIYTGGLLCETLRRRGHVDSNLRVAVSSAYLAAVPGVLAPFMPTAPLALAAFALFMFAAAMPHGGNAAALAEITPNRMRGQVTALYLFGLNMAGIGIGPTVVAAFTDKVFMDEHAVGKSIALTVAIAAPSAAFVLWATLKPYRRTRTEFARRA